MSTTVPADARAPKRQRGHLRVAAILATGAQVFSEKGYDAATMTEIGARSKTAIGSLYRFFPSKEALADALLAQFVEQSLAGLKNLKDLAANLSARELADELVDFSRRLQNERAFAIALVDVRSDGDDKRAQFRTALREGVAVILRKTLRGLPEERAAVMAVLVLHMLKGLSLDQGSDAAREAEVRLMLRLYLAGSVDFPTTLK
ncbi:TetR/AcrR family transcriptional regulator [Labrys okinawensis]|uniref:TetR/AcrR family transcriptional regulator n=1 Tax=Labrys okinawensis TaxID=346911 RepID=UPI0039BD711A